MASDHATEKSMKGAAVRWCRWSRDMPLRFGCIAFGLAKLSAEFRRRELWSVKDEQTWGWWVSVGQMECNMGRAKAASQGVRIPGVMIIFVCRMNGRVVTENAWGSILWWYSYIRRIFIRAGYRRGVMQVFAQMFSFTSRNVLITFATAFGMCRGTEAELPFEIYSVSVQSNSFSTHFFLDERTR